MTSSLGERALRRTGRTGDASSASPDISEAAAPQRFMAVSGLLREPRQPIRRLTVTDEETGEELRPLTIQDLLDGLPPSVKRRLAGLPSAMLTGLASLPAEAQRALLGLPAETQLQIIDALAGGGTSAGTSAVEGPGAMVTTAKQPTEPNLLGNTGLPPDFADFLMGGVQMPDWLGGVRIHIARPQSHGPLLLGAPPRPPVDLRPPSLSEEGNKSRREAYGDQLPSQREKPVPSGKKVQASPEVAQLGHDHVAEIKKREEAEKDDKWSSESSAPYGASARNSADSDHKQKLGEAKAKIKQLNPRDDIRERKKSTQLKEADSKHLALQQNPPDLDSVQSTAELEWKTDLNSLRKAGLTREAIDALVVRIPAETLHGYLTTSSVLSIARLALRLTPARVALLLEGCDGKIPGALTDPVADGLTGLFNAGAKVQDILGGLKSLGNQMESLLTAPAPACVTLLRVPSLPTLKAMIQGGQIAHLGALAALVPSASIKVLIEAVPTAAVLGQLFGAGAGSVQLFLGCNLSAPIMKLWCSGPTLASTITLLARPDLAQCLPMLPDLAKDQVGPTELLAPLGAGVAPILLCQSVTYAPKLLQKPSQTLAYFLANPAHTLLQYRQAKAQTVSTAAAVAPTRNGTGYTDQGVEFQKWIHSATITSPQLMMLLDESYARVIYDSTFKTTTEGSSGGDTEEYKVQTKGPNGSWAPVRWVIHLHRKFGDSKASVPIASHIKRWEERKLKVAHRIPVESALAAKCREVHT